MVTLKLNTNTMLGIEKHEKRVRLVVHKQGVENVCRIETFKNLISFASGDDRRIFGGRLQLQKNLASIVVEVKGKPEGSVLAEDFLTSLEAVRNDLATV